MFQLPVCQTPTMIIFVTNIYIYTLKTLKQDYFDQSKVENNVKFLYDLIMILLLKLYFFRLFNKYLLAIWIIFFPVISSALGVDGKAMEGVELYQQHKYDQASKKFHEAHQEKPNDPKISYNLGNSRYKQGSYEKALQNYSRSIEQNPNSTMNRNANYNMGNVLFRMNKLEESIEAYKKALEIDPSDIDSKFNLEFVREKIKKKKQNQDKSKKSKESKKNAADEGKQSNKDRKKNTQSSKEPSNPKNNPNQKKPKNNFSRKTESPSTNMTKEEAEQRLGVLTEDLKQFQRKQALEMKSIFTYQGNDW